MHVTSIIYRLSVTGLSVDKPLKHYETMIGFAFYNDDAYPQNREGERLSLKLKKSLSLTSYKYASV
jgi:hypothetical protein